MRRQYSWLCVFLSLVLLLPLFSVSVNALTVDDTYIIQSWWSDDPQYYLDFSGTVVSPVNESSITIGVQYIFNDPIEANSIFDFTTSISHSGASSLSCIRFSFHNSQNTVIDTFEPIFNGSTLTLSGVQLEEDIYRAVAIFEVNFPSWSEVDNIELLNLSIDGITYQFENGMTWQQWVNSSYNTIGLYVDEGKLYTVDKILKYNGVSVNSTDSIYSTYNYSLEELGSVTTMSQFYIYYNGNDNTTTYTCETGMTWAEWCVSDYNTSSYYIDSDGGVFYSSTMFVFEPASEGGSLVMGTDIIEHGWTYRLIKGFSPYSSLEYHYNFNVDSVSVDIQDGQGLLGMIVSWLKRVRDSIVNLPSLIVQRIQGLFVPSQDKIIEIKDKFVSLLNDRFGLAYDAIEIVDNFASAFVYSETQASIRVPEVTVNLAGTTYTVGGWEVNLIPQGFEDVVDALKLIVNIVCTGLFVNAVRKRLFEVIGDAR